MNKTDEKFFEMLFNRWPVYALTLDFSFFSATLKAISLRNNNKRIREFNILTIVTAKLKVNIKAYQKVDTSPCP